MIGRGHGEGRETLGIFSKAPTLTCTSAHDNHPPLAILNDASGDSGIPPGPPSIDGIIREPIQRIASRPAVPNVLEAVSKLNTPAGPMIAIRLAQTYPSDRASGSARAAPQHRIALRRARRPIRPWL